jgi:flagellar assembly protein FliH
MRERPLSSSLPQISVLEYCNVGLEPRAVAALIPTEPAQEEAAPVFKGVPEEEVERRVRAAREEAVAECEQQIRIENERERRESQERVQQRLAEMLQSFAEERANYFRRVEGEVVQLSLAVARKILEREAALDPTWVAVLVRVALERMQSGSSVRIHVAPAEVERWRQMGENVAARAPWEIVPDIGLAATDCIVETEMGKANFGVEAQLRQVEEGFRELLAHRPDGV